MQDKPQSWQLLEAIQSLLIKEVLPKVKDDDLLAYKTLVSWNMLGVVSREIQLGESIIDKELKSIIKLLNEKEPEKEINYKDKVDLALKLNDVLLNKIKLEKISDPSSEIWNHVKESLKHKLNVSNPKFSQN